MLSCPIVGWREGVLLLTLLGKGTLFSLPFFFSLYSDDCFLPMFPFFFFPGLVVAFEVAAAAG